MGDTPPQHNLLSGATITPLMVVSLPSNASPQLKSSFDAVALAVHACMIAVGFRLVGLGEDHRVESHSDKENTQPLPAGWNAHNGFYAFRYKHSQSSMEYLIKVTKMGNVATVQGLGMGEDKVHSFDVKALDYISEGNLPLAIGEAADTQERERRVREIFISIGRLTDLASLMRISLIQRLVPSLQKEGYEETRAQGAAASGRQPAPGREDNRPRHDPLREERDPPARPFPLHDPLAQPRGPPGRLPEPMPGFDDEYDLQRPLRGGQRQGLGNYGERDLYPAGVGPNGPLYGGVGPGLGGMGGGGGMHPTFGDLDGQGQGGPGGFNPHAPPGARFDPTGPGFGGPRGGGMGGRPPNPFGGVGNDDFI